MTAPTAARTNIESILRLEKEDEKERAFHHRIFHAIGSFVGTAYFVLLQCSTVTLWIVVNTLPAARGLAIDEYPFPLLAIFLSLEAVLLTSCVLIRQNAMDRTSERRGHLELQINLLAEQEATRSLDMLHRIADHLDVPRAKDHQSTELAEETPVDEIARDLKAREQQEVGGSR